jgi:magnesium transporter
MRNPLLTPEIREMLEANDLSALAAVVHEAHPRTVADCVSDLEPVERWRVLAALQLDARAAVVAELEPSVQDELVDQADRRDVAAILERMPPDDRADLIGRLTERAREELLPLLTKAAREDVRRLLAQTPGTVGAIMSTDFAALRPDMTVADALAELRVQAPRKETIYYAYVTDEAGRLIGFVSLKDLILAPPTARVAEVMHEDVLRVAAGDAEESAARIVEEFDLLALPVVDAEGKVVGIVTHDDVADALRREANEDFARLGAVAPPKADEAYMTTSAWRHFNRRVYWVVGLAAAGLISGLVIHGFEDALTTLVILAFYMPMVADTGGNVGSQAATVVVRALAVGEVSARDWWRVVLKEATVGLMLCSLLGALAFAKVLFLSGDTELPDGFTLTQIAWVISIALSIQTVMSTIVGAGLPILARAARLDPAVVSTPALTTIVDITGLLIYFTTAKVLLHL